MITERYCEDHCTISVNVLVREIMSKHIITIFSNGSLRTLRYEVETSSIDNEEKEKTRSLLQRIDCILTIAPI